MVKAVEISGLHVTLGRDASRVHVLNGIDLSIEAGEAVGLIGPSGSGKSTLLMVMAGLEQAETGQVIVAGENFTMLDEDALARFRGKHIGIVFQSFHLIPTMTALENVAVPLELSGHADPFGRAELELRAVGLGHRLNHFPAELSGGEQQRTSLALALIGRPKVLFLDEPTAGVDLHGRATIRHLIAEQRELGVTILMTTHEMAEAEAVADRVAILHKGALARVGALSELTGGGVRFSTSPGIDLASLSESLSVTVEELEPGRYRIATTASPELVAHLGSWLAERSLTLGELRSGASLEDTYAEIVGDLALVVPEQPTQSRRRRSRR